MSLTFEIPEEVQTFLDKLDTFIEDKILPLQHKGDNNRFFDHRREFSRTDIAAGGLPAAEWDALLGEARKLADEAGFYRFGYPKEFGGSGTDKLNLYMCSIRYFLASHPKYGGGLGLANDLQTEHSMVGNNPFMIMVKEYGTQQQRDTIIPAMLKGEFRTTFGLTEIYHGSDATHMDTVAKPITLSNGKPGYEITGNKKWQSGMHHANHCLVFARTAGKDGSPKGISAFIIPKDAPGVTVDSFQYTLNMPTDHATVFFEKVQVPETALFGPLHDGLKIAQTFTHENRIRQAASSCAAARFCINKSVEYANQRKVFGKSLSTHQAIQWPLVKLATQEEMLKLLIFRTAVEMDVITNRCHANGTQPWVYIEKELGHKIGMCNWYANSLVCKAADRAIQVHGGNGYSRHYPFEHIWRHFRRYRITEGSEEVQIRKVAAYLFGIKSTGVEEKRKGLKL
jgi:alkylation response protein AidB-like acyl-CoA dehydrogenase